MQLGFGTEPNGTYSGFQSTMCILGGRDRYGKDGCEKACAPTPHKNPD